MGSWVVIPCLLTLRDEFNQLNPNRDKGADGTIGDSSHTSTSDHTPDEDSDKLRGKDSDSKNEVHALDIDSTGPWPSQRGSFDKIVKDVIAREKQRWLDPNDMCRLNYVIWNRVIYDKDNDFVGQSYTGSDPHTNHAHFSARYETRAEDDTSPWGVVKEDDVSEQDVTNALEKFFKRDVTKTDDGKTTNITSRIGRDGLDQFVPNGVKGGKAQAWIVIEDLGQEVVTLRSEVAGLKEDIAELKDMLTMHASGIMEARSGVQNV